MDTVLGIDVSDECIADAVPGRFIRTVSSARRRLLESVDLAPGVQHRPTWPWVCNNILDVLDGWAAGSTEVRTAQQNS
eukprot:SAG31_NODE_684_length_12833_cov_8.046411_7_plen_78_part_00